MRGPIRRASIALLLLAMTMLCAAPAFAQVRSIEEGPIVRRQLLYRSNRVELVPAIAHSLNDTYQRTLFLNVAANYHLTNAFSIGVSLGWGALSYNSNITDEIEATNPTVARALAYSEKTLLTRFHLGYVPFYGKFNFLEETSVNWDFHLIGGITGALISSDSPDLEGFQFGPAFGAGWRFFFNGDMALSIDVVDHMYSVADVQRGTNPPEESFSHHVVVSLGVSFFVTGELTVSR